MTRLFVRLPNHLGDVCMSLPALTHLASKGFKLLIAGRPWIEALFAAYPFETLPLPGPRGAQLRALRTARRPGDRTALLLTNSFSSALLCRLAGWHPVGYATDGRRFLLRQAVTVPRAAHMVEYYHALARQLTGSEEPPPDHLGLQISSTARAQARSLCTAAGLKAPYVVLSPVATGLHHGRPKAWSGFDALARRLKRDGWPVVACPPAHEVEAVRRAAPTVTCLPPMDVATFAAVLEQARLVVANDSGTGHLAASVGAPLVSVFGVTDPQRTRPWSRTAIIVGGARGWPTVDDVYRQVRMALTSATA